MQIWHLFDSQLNLCSTSLRGTLSKKYWPNQALIELNSLQVHSRKRHERVQVKRLLFHKRCLKDSGCCIKGQRGPLPPPRINRSRNNNRSNEVTDLPDGEPILQLKHSALKFNLFEHRWPEWIHPASGLDHHINARLFSFSAAISSESFECFIKTLHSKVPAYLCLFLLYSISKWLTESPQ